MNYAEINNKRNLLHKAIERGTDFLFNIMDGGKTPAKKHDVEKPGIWTSAEILEFLLTNNVLPSYSLATQIDAIVDFLISKYDDSAKGWGLTADDPAGSFSAITTGHCIYVLKLYLNTFVPTERKRHIIDIIKNAEASILAKQDKKGFWIPETSTATVVSTDMNYGKLFYSFHAYYGIKKISNGTAFNTDQVLAARKRANLYFTEFANSLVNKAKADRSPNFNSKATLLGHAANLIQVLSDIDVEGNTELLAELLIIVNSYDDVFFTATTVQIFELPANSYNTFHINTPFAVFFALLAVPDSVTNLLKVVDWYLSRQDTRLHCWYYNDDCNSNIDTWSTCEALLVLSFAYTFCFENYYEGELLKVKAKYEHCDECKKKIENTLVVTTKTANRGIKKAKSGAIVSIIISIFSCVCAIISLVILSVIKNEPWINVIITAVVIPVILQIVFFLRMPELPELPEDIKNILATIGK